MTKMDGPPANHGVTVESHVGLSPDEWARRLKARATSAQDRQWRAQVEAECKSRDLAAMQHELLGAELAEAQKAAGVAAMREKAEEAARTHGPAAVTHLVTHLVRAAEDLEVARERTAERVRHIREQIKLKRA